MSNLGPTVRLLCVCGKKVRIPANASKRARKGKCPKCSAPFQFLAGRWVCLKSENGNRTPGATTHQEDCFGERNGKPSSEGGSLPQSTSFAHQAAEPVPAAYPQHEQVRRSIANALRLEDRYGGKRADAVALACHPWPDRPVSDQLRDAIAAELLPAFNINHPALDEIAADRLLRLAEVATFEDDEPLADRFFSGARLIAGTVDYDPKSSDIFFPDLPLWGMITSPLGTTVRQTSFADQVDAAEPTSADSFDTKKWEALIHGLLSGAYECGFRDIGLICGGESVDVTVDELAKHLDVELPEQAFDSHLRSLSTRKFDVIKSRSYCLGEADTLTDIADRWAVTRERVRQIETKATEEVERLFSNAFKEIGKQALQPYQSRVVKKERLHDAVLMIAEKCQRREMLAAFLLSIFGPWQTRNSWCIHATILEKVASLEQAVRLDADQYGFIDAEQLASDYRGLFFTEEDRDAYLIGVVGLGRSFGNWTIKDTMKCQAASAIKKIGRPATKEELADLLGVARHRVGGILGNIDGVVRADRYRWGFAEWVDDVYDGIVGEIEQRIDAYNGAVPMHVLVTEIPEQFGVAEGSVRAYLASSAFVVENDIVRRAEGDDYSPRQPSTCRDAVRVGARWAYRSSIYERHFNGYSLGINFDVAYANGLRPGDDLIVPIEGCDYQVSLIWRSHNLNRLVDVGRISDYLRAEGYEAGDFVLILPSRTRVELIREDQGDELSFGSEEVDGQQNQQDQQQQWSDPLLDLLGDT